MSKKRVKLSDQLRRAITEAPMTRYRLAKLSGVDEGLLGKFVRGERAGLRLDTVDAIAEVLRLRLATEEPEKKEKG
jgi:transcriptional regulator with XRE-family HTH domain